MNQHDAFESRLAAAFGALADGAPVDVDPVALASGVATARAGRWALPRVGRVPRRLVLVGLAALLALASVLALAGAARLLEERRPVHGLFSPAGELPASSGDDRYINTAAVLADGRVLITGMYASSGPADSWAFVYDPGPGTWAPTKAAPASRRGATATTLPDGRVLLAGGRHIDAEGNLELPAAAMLYDPAGATFEPKGTLKTPRQGHTATLLTDGSVLVAGGGDAGFAPRGPMSSAEIFDPESGTFAHVASMTVPRELHAATRLADGRVLMTGGLASNEGCTIASAEIFDPSSGTFTPTGDMSVARFRHAAVALPDGRVLVVGGATRGPDGTSWRPTASAELFDPESGTFTPTSPLMTERTGPGAVLLADDRVLVAGGTNDFGGPRTAELFDPATGRFEPAGASAGPHGDAWAGALPDGRVLLLGLVDDPWYTGVPEVWTVLDEGDFAPTTGSHPGPGFQALASDSSVLRSDHSATLLTDGRILLAGGRNAAVTESGALATAEILDPASGTTTPVGHMSTPRAGHVAVLLNDGRVLIAGGEVLECPPEDGSCAGWPAPTAEIFDPAIGRFTPIDANLGPARFGMRDRSRAATRLSDGRVLYVGGMTAVGGADPPNAHFATIIDPISGASDPTDPVPCPGRVSLAPLRDGRTFVTCDGWVPGTYLYDAAGASITPVDPAQAWDAAVTLGDGRVLVVRETGDAATFDPSAWTFTPTGSAKARRDPPSYGYMRQSAPYSRQLTLLADGWVLVSGGWSDPRQWTPIASAEIFDPATGLFRSVGPMAAERFQHTATSLDDGRVVLVGGVKRSPDRSDPEPALAEIFDPGAVPSGS